MGRRRGGSEDPETAGRVIDGEALARRLRRRVASRIVGARRLDPTFPVPTLGLVTVEVHPDTARFVALKERAFREAGLAVRERILPADADASFVRGALSELAGHPDVHGLFLQYPLPPGVDADACSEAIPLAMDVDASSAAARRLLAKGREPFAPATPEAVVRILAAAGIGRTAPSDAGSPTVTVLAGEGAVVEPLVVLLERRGLPVDLLDPEGPDTARAVARARVLVTCAGRPGVVDGRRVADGAVVVDAGYHHPDGRGDLDPGPDPRRLAAYAPARGGVGPLTVAVLMEHTFGAAVRAMGRTGPRTG